MSTCEQAAASCCSNTGAISVLCRERVNWAVAGSSSSRPGLSRRFHSNIPRDSFNSACTPPGALLRLLTTLTSAASLSTLPLTDGVAPSSIRLALGVAKRCEPHNLFCVWNSSSTNCEHFPGSVLTLCGQTAAVHTPAKLFAWTAGIAKIARAKRRKNRIVSTIWQICRPLLAMCQKHAQAQLFKYQPDPLRATTWHVFSSRATCPSMSSGTPAVPAARRIRPAVEHAPHWLHASCSSESDH